MNTSQKKIWVVLCMLILNSSLIAQTKRTYDSYFNPEQGNYFIKNYSRAFLQNSNTNWSVLQDKNGLVYIGNQTDGFSVYDGKRVKRVIDDKGLPTKGFSRDIVVDSKNILYTTIGSFDFGTIEINKFGESVYTSLSNHLPEKDKVNTIIWGVGEYHDTIFIQSENIIYTYKDKKLLKAYHFENKTHIMQVTPAGVFVRIWDKGLYQFINGSFELIPSTKTIFAQNRIDAMYLLQNGDHVLISRNIGLWVLKKDHSLVKANSSIIDELAIKGSSYSGGDVLKDGVIPMTTNLKGLVFFDQKFNLKSIINTTNGINDEHITAYSIDRTGDVWGTNAEIFKLNFDSSITYFSKINGIKGDLGNIKRIKGKLYIRTSIDLFEFNPRKSIEDVAKFIPKGINEIGSNFTEFGNQIITPSNYTIKSTVGNKVSIVSNVYRSRESIQSKINPSLLFSANLVYGVQLNKFQNGKWSNVPIINKTPINSRNIFEVAPGKIILNSLEGPIYEYNYDKSGQGVFTKYIVDKKFTTKEGYQLQMFNDSVLLAYDSLSNFYSIDINNHTIHYTGFNFKKFKDPIEWGYSYNSQSKNGWLLIDNKLLKTKFDLIHGFTFEEYPIYKLDFAELSKTLFAEGDAKNEVIWLGSQDDKIYRYLPEIAKNQKAIAYSVLLRAVSNQTNKLPILLNEIPYNQNSLTFEVAYPIYGNEEKTQYRFWLEGQDDNWSAFTTDAKKEYTNLHEGKYILHVIAKDASGLNSKEYTQSFTILPPWYRTIWAYLFYGSLLVFSFYLFGRYNAKKSFKKAEDKRKTAELEAAKDLQNRLLPKKIPQLHGYDIAGFLRTSTEVGGDYYDFFLQEDGALYAICGDATGHGTPSGMLVSITKAGIIGLPRMDPNKMLIELNRVVKKVDLGILRMSLNIAFLKDNLLALSSAGMPPYFLYRKLNNKTEEILIKGVPLGSFNNVQYDQIQTTFDSGDVLLIISDGLPEAPNLEGQLFDYEKVQSLLTQIHAESAEKIIEILMNQADEWLAGQHNPDDITLIVIKHL